MSITQKKHLKGNDSVFCQSIISGCLKTWMVGDFKATLSIILKIKL
jgi:hypothetical protein